MIAAEQDQRDITCMGRTFSTVRTADGSCYISIPALCDALGLIVGSQVRRIKRNEHLFAGLRHSQLTTKGGVQRVNCLHINCLQAWFDGIQTGSLSSEAQEALRQLQTALPPLLSQLFQNRPCFQTVLVYLQYCQKQARVRIYPQRVTFLCPLRLLRTFR